MKKRGLLHLYIGKGKGKTSAALGLALRAHGAKKKVCFIQFLKARASSEIALLKKLKMKTVLFKEKHPLFYKSISIEALKRNVLKDLKAAEMILKDKRYNFIVLDEILYLLEDGFIEEGDIIRLIESKPKETELVLTGGSATERIIKLANYVSIISDAKHPFKKGISARKGIEY